MNKKSLNLLNFRNMNVGKLPANHSKTSLTTWFVLLIMYKAVRDLLNHDSWSWRSLYSFLQRAPTHCGGHIVEDFISLSLSLFSFGLNFCWNSTSLWTDCSGFSTPEVDWHLVHTYQNDLFSSAFLSIVSRIFASTRIHWKRLRTL